MPETRKLDPLSFLFLAISAEAFGGIGAGAFTEYDSSETPLAPFCVWGHAGEVFYLDKGQEDRSHVEELGHVREALRRAGITYQENDRAVNTINDGLLSADPDARVPFEAWAEELNIEVAEQ